MVRGSRPRPVATIILALRFMLPHESNSLTTDKVYASAAYPLNLNGVAERPAMYVQMLPKASMPTREGFATT
jgi:hypothetical protein